MATETYKYFEPESSNLYAAYGGGAIQTGRGTAEMEPEDLFIRHIVKQEGWLAERTNQVAMAGLDGSSDLFFRVSDDLYSSISSYLTAAQLITVVSSAPAGWVVSSTEAKLMPEPGKRNILIIGDSLSVCQGATTPFIDHPICGVINDMAGETLVFSENDRKAVSASYCVLNVAISGSTFDGTDVYPENWADAYNQHLKTMPEPPGGFIIVLALGSNDIGHDASVTGADCWGLAQTMLGLLTTDFPNSAIIMQTLIKRTEGATLNGKLDDYNVLLRANYASVGGDVLADVEDDVAELNIDTGDTTDLAIYSDPVHPTTAAYVLEKPTFAAALTAAEAL